MGALLVLTGRRSGRYHGQGRNAGTAAFDPSLRQPKMIPQARERSGRGFEPEACQGFRSFSPTVELTKVR
jgi:hypothetical protein